MEYREILIEICNKQRTVDEQESRSKWWIHAKLTQLCVLQM